MADDSLISPLTDTAMRAGDVIPGLRNGNTVHFSPAQLPGGAGSQGPQGIQGVQGPQGPIGPAGPTGSGANVTITDGTNTISGAAELSFTGATLSGNSTLAVVSGLAGFPELTTTALTSNSTPFTLPANAVIHYVIFRETAGHNISVGLGTSSGSNDLLPVQAVSGHSVCLALPQQMNDVWLSATDTMPLYVNSGSWGSASINVKIGYTGGP